ncbi:c-type cytochrome [Variovorax sp. PCZ-1]|nr:c-type cytochrome [Variovorax sp. PCZ-1]MBS7808452.1 c-type cytochrome [Variovorax sp. PCZ-1]
MHCLPSKAGLALGSVLTALGLSAFFGSAYAQSQEAVQRGMAIYTAKCSACHSVEDNRVGPSHAGVLGRRAGAVKNYEYSEALAKSKVVWNRANLERWLTDPEKVIPGQRMGYRLSLPQERADVVAYLATLSAPK